MVEFKYLRMSYPEEETKYRDRVSNRKISFTSVGESKNKDIIKIASSRVIRQEYLLLDKKEMNDIIKYDKYALAGYINISNVPNRSKRTKDVCVTSIGNENNFDYYDILPYREKYTKLLGYVELVNGTVVGITEEIYSNNQLIIMIILCLIAILILGKMIIGVSGGSIQDFEQSLKKIDTIQKEAKNDIIDSNINVPCYSRIMISDDNPYVELKNPIENGNLVDMKYTITDNRGNVLLEDTDMIKAGDYYVWDASDLKDMFGDSCKLLNFNIRCYYSNTNIECTTFDIKTKVIIT